MCECHNVGGIQFNGVLLSLRCNVSSCFDGTVLLYGCLTAAAALVLGKTIAAKPTKIVAGHEADRTNELLQALAEAINKKVCKIYPHLFLLTVVWMVCLHVLDKSCWHNVCCFSNRLLS